ncbi:reverse transcriptase domain-containing protein [Tanacetum coccineum]|uniref:Reverse transcriptase domain-containing protein n=1 Tax=Tanacetum coccineum TaxID=301880 RepID=A0ABQ5HKP6_9ASTR
MTPIIEYLKDRTLPGDRKEESKLRIKAKQYELLEVILCKRSFLKPWLWTTIGSSQGYSAGILLANNAPGRTRNDTYMQRLSNTSSRAKKPSTSANPNHGPAVPNQGMLGRRKQELGRGTPHVMWALRTMIKSSHGDTPFFLTYGTEVVIPADKEIKEKAGDGAAICEAKAKMKMTKYYHARVRGVAFRPGDFVYRSNNASHAAAGGKLLPKWEGPYEVTEALGDGAYS